MTQASIIAEILAERARQDKQWGGSKHDDEHVAGEWLEFIANQAEKMAYIPTDARMRFIKIAALAIAAIESIDRRLGAGL